MPRQDENNYSASYKVREYFLFYRQRTLLRVFEYSSLNLYVFAKLTPIKISSVFPRKLQKIIIFVKQELNYSTSI